MEKWVVVARRLYNTANGALGVVLLRLALLFVRAGDCPITPCEPINTSAIIVNFLENKKCSMRQKQFILGKIMVDV
jgi:hypothetical protein